MGKKNNAWLIAFGDMTIKESDLAIDIVVNDNVIMTVDADTESELNEYKKFLEEHINNYDATVTELDYVKSLLQLMLQSQE